MWTINKFISDYGSKALFIMVIALMALVIRHTGFKEAENLYKKRLVNACAHAVAYIEKRKEVIADDIVQKYMAEQNLGAAMGVADLYENLTMTDEEIVEAMELCVIESE